MIRWLVTEVLAPRLFAVPCHRKPDLIIGADNPDGAYLYRWWVIPRNKWLNVYLHCFLRSDDDRALHDHEYVNVSVLLLGRYAEHRIAAGGVHRRTVRTEGDVCIRLPSTAHRIEVIADEPCWSLFLTGPRVRRWGFHCPERGWVPWQTFTAEGRPGEVGPGCEG